MQMERIIRLAEIVNILKDVIGSILRGLNGLYKDCEGC
jgi:hypothetical protein